MMKLEQKGFVKHEVVIATLFVAVMTAFMVFVMSKKLQDAKEAACDRNVKMITRQLEVWHAERGAYPESPKEMDRFMREFFPEGRLVCPVTGSSQSYTIDLVTHEVRCEHWGKAKPK
jgi:competence protein ComGC